METPNLSYITNMCGGNTESEQKILNIIKKEFPIEKEEFLKNLNSKSFKIAASNVHKIKHKFSILGLEKGYEIAQAFEKNLLAGNKKLDQEFNSILDSITDYLEKS